MRSLVPRWKTCRAPLNMVEASASKVTPPPGISFQPVHGDTLTEALASSVPPGLALSVQVARLGPRCDTGTFRDPLSVGSSSWSAKPGPDICPETAGWQPDTMVMVQLTVTCAPEMTDGGSTNT